MGALRGVIELAKEHRGGGPIAGPGNVPEPLLRRVGLAQHGKLRLDDSITRYFDDVPADKRAITLEHLMTGASGLPDFHDLPSEFADDWVEQQASVGNCVRAHLGRGGENPIHRDMAFYPATPLAASGAS